MLRNLHLLGGLRRLRAIYGVGAPRRTARVWSAGRFVAHLVSAVFSTPRDDP